MAEGLIGGALGDEEEKPEVEEMCIRDRFRNERRCEVRLG